MASRQVTIVNPEGLHARPAFLFARLASRFTSEVEVLKDGQRVNGKSSLDILMLGADCGAVLWIEARGADAQEAVETLAGLLDQESLPDDSTD